MQTYFFEGETVAGHLSLVQLSPLTSVSGHLYHQRGLQVYQQHNWNRFVWSMLGVVDWFVKGEDRGIDEEGYKGTVPLTLALLNLLKGKV
jgi:hypothetical protein